MGLVLGLSLNILYFYFFLIDPPSITYFPQSRYTVNETNNVTMVCRANGVPTPKIVWKKTGSNKELGSGEQFVIVKPKGSDDGTYTCTATNELGQDSREVTLNVQSKYEADVLYSRSHILMLSCNHLFSSYFLGRFV